MLYRHSVLLVLYIIHEPIWGLIVKDDVYLILLLHEIFMRNKKLQHWEHVWHVFDFLGMILKISPLLFTGTFSILKVFQLAMYSYWVWKYFEIPLLNWCLFLQLSSVD